LQRLSATLQIPFVNPAKNAMAVAVCHPMENVFVVAIIPAMKKVIRPIF
jgi:hypothetical protein